MNTAIATRFLTVFPSKFEIQRLYQLIREAEACYFLKDAQGQHELGTILQEYPHPFNVIGEYYDAFYLNHIGKVLESKDRLERVIETAPLKYRAKGILTLSGVEEMQGNFDESMRLRLEVLKFNQIPFTVESEFGIAVLLGRQGDHKHAVKVLESFLPGVQLFKGTPLFFDYLNSYAIELSEVGRIHEALSVIKTVLSSPYVPHFLNWPETGQELTLKAYKSRSTISFIQKKKDNLLYLSEHERSERHRRSPFDQPRGVSTIADWKKKMGKEPNGNGEESEDMSPQDMAMKIVEMITKNREDEESLRKLMEYAKELFSK